MSLNMLFAATLAIIFSIVGISMMIAAKRED